ncbi:MAG: DUF2190 family protein [Chromatiales bacterium]|nr:DUF2190 family protein [Gammaproteobacteria bacterium]
MKNFIKNGDRMTWLNSTGAAVLSGDPVVVGDRVFVACVDIPDGQSGELATTGVFRIAKTAVAVNQGKTAYLDPATGEVTETATDNVKVGTFWGAAAAGDSLAHVCLHG